MANQYPLRVRSKREEIHTFQVELDIHNVTPTGVAVPTQLPSGAYSMQLNIWATDLDKPVVIKVQPYVDDLQTLVDGSFKFLEIGATTATTNITVEANTSTAKGYVRIVIPAGDQYGAAAPALTLFGAQYTVVTTATTGILKIAVLAVEI